MAVILLPDCQISKKESFAVPKLILKLMLPNGAPQENQEKGQDGENEEKWVFKDVIVVP